MPCPGSERADVALEANQKVGLPLGPWLAVQPQATCLLSAPGASGNRSEGMVSKPEDV